MDRIKFLNHKNFILRGVFQEGDNGRLIIMCHGFRSNRSSRGRFDRFAETFHQHGYSILRFDFGGCGESDDRPLSLAGEIDDLTSAIQFAVSLGYKDIALYGHSLGARVCLETPSSPYIKSMILTGAGTAAVKYDWNEEFTNSQLEELEKTGCLTLSVEDPYRDTITISQQMLLDFEEMNQEKTLLAIHCPVLFIHGDQGEEKLLLPLTKKGMRWLPNHSKLEVIEGSGHSFEGHLDIVEAHAVLWLKKHF